MKFEFVPPAQCGGGLEKVKLYKARHLVEMTVARQPDMLKICFGPFSDAETVHRDKHGDDRRSAAVQTSQCCLRQGMEMQIEPD
jgi:hypothetical protein